MIETDALLSEIGQFELKVAEESAMPVYWINTPDFAPGFRAAKGTPDEMQSEVDRIVQQCLEVNEAINVRDEESAKNFLARNHIGMDCSAFIFHLLDRVLEKDGKNLQGSLYVPKEGIVKASTKESWRSAHELTDAEAAVLPKMVPLDWVCETFNKEPAFQVNVARLCSDASSDQVDSLEEVAEGDLVYMARAGKAKHVAIVTRIGEGALEIWDSYREDASYGGIMPHEIRITDTSLPLEAQEWTHFDTSRYDEFAFRRLKVVAETE